MGKSQFPPKSDAVVDNGEHSRVEYCKICDTEAENNNLENHKRDPQSPNFDSAANEAEPILSNHWLPREYCQIPNAFLILKDWISVLAVLLATADSIRGEGALAEFDVLTSTSTVVARRQIGDWSRDGSQSTTNVTGTGTAPGLKLSQLEEKR